MTLQMELPVADMSANIKPKEVKSDYKTNTKIKKA